MENPVSNGSARLRAIVGALAESHLQETVTTALEASQGDFATARPGLAAALAPETMARVDLAHSLAVMSGDDTALIGALVDHPKISSLRDVALHFDAPALAALTTAVTSPDQPDGARLLADRLFHAETSAVMSRLVRDGGVPVAEPVVRDGVADLLAARADFDIRTMSVLNLLGTVDALDAVPAAHRPAVAELMKSLQRVQAIAPTADAVPALLDAGLTSAFAVASMPESAFVAAMVPVLGEDGARTLHANAVDVTIRNELALMTMREAWRGSGLAVLDGTEGAAARAAGLQNLADKHQVPLTLENLFGSLDYCECDECQSVYSPAAYFVELLQYLRNNNLKSGRANTGRTGYADTPLEQLFRRRPDLGCLELTCENTFTVLPYIDLANEVMESFVVHLDQYAKDANRPRQATLEVFNVDGETTAELLAQPQHTNHHAYCILKSAVYPFTLPYHQPIDAARIFLGHLKTSRYELIDVFRTADEATVPAGLGDAELAELHGLHRTVQDRAADAEYLGLTQEEYIILTGEAFWPKRYFELTQKTSLGDDTYRKNIGVRPVHEYYGYGAEADMLDTGPAEKGLSFVKKQFLRRTGIAYTDLVALLKIRCINPDHPQGLAKTVLESIGYGYRFLQSLVDTSSSDPAVRFARVVEHLSKSRTLIPAAEPGPCQRQPEAGPCIGPGTLRRWVHCWFERIGKLIVLESGDRPRIEVYGLLYAEGVADPVGRLLQDGTIVKPDGTVVGKVAVTPGIVKGGVVFDPAGERLGSLAGDDAAAAPDGASVDVAGPVVWQESPADFLRVGGSAPGSWAGFIHRDRLLGRSENLTLWRPPADSCDLTTTRLMHLDGSPLTVTEYDRFHRFIRLWRRLGWTIDETDQAIAGLGAGGGGSGGSGSAGGSDDGSAGTVGFDAFSDDCTVGETSGAAGSDGDCGCGGGGTGDDPAPDDEGSGGCPPPVAPGPGPTPALLHQVSMVKMLLHDTGLDLDSLLTFWSPIATRGEASLYRRLFLRHTLLGLDDVFMADAHGNYLTRPAKISDHIPILMAALRLKADDIAAVMAMRTLADALTLANVSVLYRHALLARLLHVKVADLDAVIGFFGNPFTTAAATRELLAAWSAMEDAGLTFRQLNFAVNGNDTPDRPLAPPLRTVLVTAQTLYDGLNGIDAAWPGIPADHGEAATADAIRAAAGHLYDQQLVAGILDLLQGTGICTTNAPAGLSIVVPAALAKRLKYTEKAGAIPPEATIQITGIPGAGEIAQAKGLSNHPGWSDAIDRAVRQPARFFNDNLAGLFSDAAAARKVLLGPDYTNPADPQDAANTAPVKRLYFLNALLPVLRRRLGERLAIDAAAGVTGLAADVTALLVTDVLRAGTPALPVLDILLGIKDQPAGTGMSWKGYLIPATDGVYTFVATGDTKPPPILLDGQPVPFPNQHDDPTNVWSSDPVRLRAGRPLALEISDRPAESLQWKTPSGPMTAIPKAVLLPDHATAGTTEAITRLLRTAILVNALGLDVDEIAWWQSHGSDFAVATPDHKMHDFDFNALLPGHWRRLVGYARLRDDRPRRDNALVSLFAWAAIPGNTADLVARIVAASGWDADTVGQLIDSGHFNLGDPALFRNEIPLIQLARAVALVARIGVPATQLFVWAAPGSKFWHAHRIAEDIRRTVRARYDQAAWDEAVRPLNDTLREHQKQALIDYLLVQPALIDWGVVDADSLFEFFLIDVQMCACMQTSRIKQAISSVQLYVQRCLLGLEAPHVPVDALDRGRWEWMQRYRVWEANRKVFCYPENWIEPSLRDDKSPFFKDFESDLLQKELDPATIHDALTAYLFKVDEVANLRVVGLYRDPLAANGTPFKLHVFACTRNPPHRFYYRAYDSAAREWQPWLPMQVDITAYDSEDDQGRVLAHGIYLTPAVWNDRILAFFPQFVKKTRKVDVYFKDNGTERPATTQEVANIPSDELGNSEFWEIRLAWTELRGGRWTQKQVSQDQVTDFTEVFSPDDPKYTWSRRRADPISDYQFMPEIAPGGGEVRIWVFRDGIDKDSNQRNTRIGVFRFTGSQIRAVETLGHDGVDALFKSRFHYVNNRLGSFQRLGSGPIARNVAPYVDDVPNGALTITTGVATENFSHRFVHSVLGTINAGSLDDVFAAFRSIAGTADKNDAYGGELAEDAITYIYNELRSPYAIYNWETAFHAPALLADRLFKANQFEQALAVCRYILDPFADGEGTQRFWQFLPFRETKADRVLEDLFARLRPRQPNEAISAWRDKPFQPHVVARQRPSAYMRWIAMTYIEILVAWGDSLFRQDTIETVNQATQLYVLAAHLYGPRGIRIPRRGTVRPETYNSLVDKWDAFGNAMVELELAFPFSNQIDTAGEPRDGSMAQANVFGFATTLYFCIPDNPKLRGLRDTIDDRLFKIRHCQNIEGVFRQLPLFEPPIDPALLVQAAAHGISLSTVLADLNAPMPNYRFYYLLQKAVELCGEVKSLGAAFLAAREKGDAEALARLRAGQDIAIQTLVMEVRKKQLEEQSLGLAALRENRKAPVYRLQHYLKLIGEDLGKVPDEQSTFAELPNLIEAPIDVGGLKLIRYEKEEIDKASEAADWQIGVGVVETLASVFHALPTMHGDAHPLGVGADVVWGFPNLANATTAVGRGLRIKADHLSFQSSSAARKAGFLRQLQDRVMQANNAGYEIKNIDRQILIQEIRIAVAEQEIANQQKQIDNVSEVEEFLKTKYSNRELYSWMEGQVRTMHYRAYTLAYELARKAEKTYCFERGLSSAGFIQAGYWDPARDGLMAGERLHLALKQLEAAYMEKRGHDFEIAKSVSLRLTDPLALIRLKATGTCEFAAPEILFDMDYPGHYMRRIKSVALTMPCIVGPYTGLNCTLRLLEHKFRVNSTASGKSDYPEKRDETDDRFATANVPIAAIAASTGQNDSGVFDLNFRDERYLPFEGAGAISRWRLEFTDGFRQFDYDTIADLILQIRYTSVDGGDKLRAAAEGALADYVKAVEEESGRDGLFVAFDLSHEFANAWRKAMQPPAGATSRVAALDGLSHRLPLFAQGRPSAKVKARNLYLFTPAALAKEALTVSRGTDEVTFDAGPHVKELNSYVSGDGLDLPVDNWLLTIGDVTTAIDRMWLVVRFVLV